MDVPLMVPPPVVFSDLQTPTTLTELTPLAHTTLMLPTSWILASILTEMDVLITTPPAVFWGQTLTTLTVLPPTLVHTIPTWPTRWILV
jgi:hypothetical protein